MAVNFLTFIQIQIHIDLAFYTVSALEIILGMNKF